MNKIRWFLWIALVALALTLALQNSRPAMVHLLWMETTLSLSLLLLTFLFAGFIAGGVMTAMTLRARRPATPRESKTKPSAAATDPVADRPRV